jgi:type VI secretion system protein ImpF
LTVDAERGQPGISPSLLDRLIDPASGGTTWRPGYALDQIMDTVRRDLEDLLNTQRPGLAAPGDSEAAASVVNFGVPELVSISGDAKDLGPRVARALEDVIRRFEPRLRDVRVVPLNRSKEDRLGLHFEINARLRVDPSPEVAYLTVLKLTTGQATIERSGSA